MISTTFRKAREISIRRPNQKMKFHSIIAIVLLLSISPSNYAHHGVNGQFDQSKNVTVTGVITNIRFVNPHSYVYLDVTNEAGSVDAWRCELSSGNTLKRNGWSTEMFKIGSSITIDGLPARREPFGCLAETMTFENGSVVGNLDVLNEAELSTIVAKTAFADGTPNINGNWVAERRIRRPPPNGSGMGQAMAAGMAMAGARGPVYSQTVPQKVLSAR